MKLPCQAKNKNRLLGNMDNNNKYKKAVYVFSYLQNEIEQEVLK